MTVMNGLPTATKTTSAAIIDGLLAGVLSGAGMGVLILAIEWTLGHNPLEVLGWFAPSSDRSPVVGGLAHLAVSGIYGMLFGWLAHLTHSRRGSRFPTWLLGLLFGLAIFLFAELVRLPGSLAALENIPIWLFGLAHGVFGVLLGWLFERKDDERG